MRKRRLIINADDFGWGCKLTDKIIRCHKHGIVTSTTLLVNMPGTEYAVKQIHDVPKLSVGLHLNLTVGKPITCLQSIPSLIDETGNFPGNAVQSKSLWRGGQFYKQVRLEVEAQVKRCFDLGVTPTHVDSHHGIHKMPVVQRSLIEVLKRYGITKIRTPLSHHRMRKDAPFSSAVVPWLKNNLKRCPVIMFHALSHYRLRKAGFLTPDWKATVRMGVPARSTPREELMACIAAVPYGCSEILLHPGDYGEEDKPTDWMLKTWAEDTPICLDQGIAEFIRKSNIELINFRALEL